MSDDRRDIAVEDRVRAALESLAATTSIAPDGWDRIESQVEGRRRRRLAAWSVGGPAVAFAAVALLVALLPTDDSGDPTVTAGPAGEALARYAPQGLENEGLSLRSVQFGGPSRAAPSDARVRVYGHRAADGASLDKLALVVTATTPEAAGQLRALAPGSPGQARCEPAASCIGLPVTPMTLRGRELEVTESSISTSSGELGAAKVVWSEANGPTIGVLTTWLRSQYPIGEYLGADFRTVVEGVNASGGDAAATVLPEGYIEIHKGNWPPIPSTLSPDDVLQLWSTEGGGSAPSQFTLEIHQGAGVSLDTRAWITPDAVATTTDDRPALHSAAEGSLTWSPRDGVVLAVVAEDQPLDRLRFLAESVKPLSEEAWSALVNGSPVSSLPIASPEPRAGVATTIASGEVGGEEWTLSYRDGEPACLDLHLSSGLSGTCEFERAGAGLVGTPLLLEDPNGFFQPRSTVSAIVVATIGADVASVKYLTGDPGPHHTTPQLVSAGDGLRFAILPVAASDTPPGVIVGLDSQGREVDRKIIRLFDLPDAPRAPPTTAGE